MSSDGQTPRKPDGERTVSAGQVPGQAAPHRPAPNHSPASGHRTAPDRRPEATRRREADNTLPRQRDSSRRIGPVDELPAEGGLSDAALIARIRAGEPELDGEAYKVLYQRHAEAVRRYARTCCRDAHTADDLTNEVFTRTLQAVHNGKGPETSVRAYLLTSVRHVAAAWTKTQKREELVEDFAVFARSSVLSGPGSDEGYEPGTDVRAMQQAERTLVARAFSSLSEKDRMILWHTAVEDAKPRDIAPLLGVTGNASAVAAHRARENLKTAYLQAHVSRSLTAGGECARYADQLGAYARGGLRRRAEVGLRTHLQGCAECREAAAEVLDLNGRIRLVVPVALIGWFGTVGGAKAFGALLSGTGAASAAGLAGAAAGKGAVAEGVGAPLKAAVVTSTLTAMGVAAALALMGSEEPKVPVAEPPPTAPVSPSKEPEQPEPAPPEASAKPPEPEPPPESEPEPEPEPAPARTREPSPAPKPEPVPKPELPAKEYRLNSLRWDALRPPLDGLLDGETGEAGGTGGARREPAREAEPTFRLGGSSWLWQRRGLHVAGRQYEHGVSTNAPSSVIVDLHRECTAYEALAGVDEWSALPGAVRFAVYGDGVRLWSSGVVRAGERPVPVQVPLGGVESMRLEVLPQEPVDSATQADWLEARVNCR